MGLRFVCGQVACRIFLLNCVVTVAISAGGQALNPAYLADMPSVGRVKAEVQGNDAADTMARQVAVFAYLQQYIQRIKYNRSARAPFTPDETRMLGAYAQAAQQITQSYNSSHSAKENGDFDRLQFNYTMNNADGWARKLIGPQTNAAYNNAQGEMAQRQQAHNEAIKNANEAAAKAGANAKGLDPTSVAARRCVELGGNTAACAGKSFLGGMMETFTGVDMGTEMDKVNRVGVFLSGVYQSPAAQTQVGFDLSGAHITGCGKLTADDRGYTLRRGGGGLQVVLSNQPAPIALGLRADGGLAGPGLVDVTGRIVVGYTTTTSTLMRDGVPVTGCNGNYGKCTSTTSTPQYGTATARCTIGALNAPVAGPATPKGAAADDGSLLGMMTSVGTTVAPGDEPGLRMYGKFASASGLLLDFEGDAVTLDCGMAHIKTGYTVENAPGELRLHVNNPGGAFVLAVAPDNTLHGAANTTVNGKLFASMNNGQVSFRPVSASCAVGVFAVKSPDEYKALISK